MNKSHQKHDPFDILYTLEGTARCIGQLLAHAFYAVLALFSIYLCSNLLTNESHSRIILNPLLILVYHPLLIPLLKVSSILLKYFSRSNLYNVSLLLVCSKMVTFKFARLWPGRLKCAPVALLKTWLLMYPLCSANLCLSWRPVVPTYICEHFWHSNKYIMLNDSREMFLLIFHVLVLLILICFPSYIYGHAVQDFVHLYIPMFALLGYGLGGGATFDFIRMFLIFDCLLNAMSGGLVKQSFKYLSWLTIAL